MGELGLEGGGGELEVRGLGEMPNESRRVREKIGARSTLSRSSSRRLNQGFLKRVESQSEGKVLRGAAQRWRLVVVKRVERLMTENNMVSWGRGGGEREGEN